MKALKLLPDKTYSVIDIKEPRIKDTEILIKLGACGMFFLIHANQLSIWAMKLLEQ
jgi:hypothetical protein